MFNIFILIYILTLHLENLGKTGT